MPPPARTGAVVNTAGPLEVPVAVFVLGGLGEFVGELQPLVASVGADRPLDNDEDHGCALALRAPAGTAPLAVTAIDEYGLTNIP
jgi:hypothetical protein